MAETYISLIKATNWVDLSPEHTQLRQTLESDIANTCCGNEYRQPIMLQGAFGIGKTTTLNYLFHYAWEVLKVPTFHILLSDLVEIIKTTAKDQGVEQIQNEDLGRIIKSAIDDQIEKLKNSDWTSLTNVMFPDFISLDEEHPLTLNEYLKGFNPVEIDACIDDQTKQILSNGFTQDVIKEAINSQNVPLLLIDEFESKFTELKRVVTSSGGGILRALFDQVVSNKPFYLIIGNGPGSAYEISKEQGTEESTDNEAASERRLKSLQIPFPTVSLLQDKLLRNEPKGYANFIWWTSRCRPGQIKRLHDTIDYQVYSKLAFHDFITKSIFSKPIDGTGNDAVKYLKTEYFNNIDSQLWTMLSTWLLNFEPCKLTVTRDYRNALMSCPDTFFVSDETVHIDKISVCLQKDICKYLKEKQDKGMYVRVDYLKNLHKYFCYVLGACSNSNGEIAFKTPNKRYEESFANSFAIPLLEIVYDLISQYEDDNDSSFKQTKDFILDCIKWTETAIEERDLNLKYDETFQLFDYNNCTLRDKDEVNIQFSLSAIRQIIEQPIGDPRLKYKDISLDILLPNVNLNSASIIYAEKQNCKIIFVPILDEGKMQTYLKRVKQYVDNNKLRLLHHGKETMKIVFLGHYDDKDLFADSLIKTTSGDLTPLGKMNKLEVDSYDEYNFKFGGKTCDFIDSIVKISIIGVAKGEIKTSNSDCSYDIEEAMRTIGSSVWSTRKEERRTIEHYSKLVTEGENCTIDTICKNSKSHFMSSMESLICPLSRYNSSLDFDLLSLFDENTMTYESLSRFVSMMYIVEHAQKIEEVSPNLVELLKLVGVRSSKLYFEPRVDESAVHQSYHLDEIYNILRDKEKTQFLLKHIDTESDFYSAINDFTSMIADEKVASNITHGYIKFLKNDISGHWIGEYNSVMSNYSATEGDILMRLSYAFAVSKSVDYSKLRQETVSRIDAALQHIQTKRTELVESIAELKDDLFPVGSRGNGDPLAGYMQVLQHVIALCKLIKTELSTDTDSLSTYLILETLTWRIENMKTSMNTLCGQLKDIADRISRKRDEIRSKYQVPVDALLKDKLVALLVNETDPIGTIKPPFDNDIFWRKYAWKVGSSDKLKYVLFDKNPSPNDKEAHFKIEEVDVIRKSIESIYVDLCNSAFKPIHELCIEKVNQVQAYKTMQEYVTNLINNPHNDTN